MHDINFYYSEILNIKRRIQKEERAIFNFNDFFHLCIWMKAILESYLDYYVCLPRIKKEIKEVIALYEETKKIYYSRIKDKHNKTEEEQEASVKRIIKKIKYKFYEWF